MLTSLLSNFPLWTSVTAIILAQLLKIPWHYTLTKEWDWRWIYFSGGMPSGHTSAVTSLSIAIGLTSGWNSPLFAISTILSIIVMYDATGVRRQAGMHAQVINRLVADFAVLISEIRHMKERTPEQTMGKLKEILGHKPIEVFVGALFGIFIALTMYWIWFN